MNLKISMLVLFIVSMGIVSCGKDDDNDTQNVQATFDLAINGLESLGAGYAYEGWIIVNGAAVSTGVFSVDNNGMLSKTEFQVLKSDLDAATTFVLTIEPSPDNDPSPSSVHILAGDFANNSAVLSISHKAALDTDFSLASGNYILATPTDNDENNEDSGIWFLDNSSGSPVAGLTLPSLPEGWAYEGWVVINGSPVSTGTFVDVASADDSAVYSGMNAGPPYPGEDFLINAPTGFNFPTSLKGGTAVISVEPVPDNSAAPFVLKPLVGNIPSGAPVHSVLSVGQNLSFPTGTVNR